MDEIRAIFNLYLTDKNIQKLYPKANEIVYFFVRHNACSSYLCFKERKEEYVSELLMNRSQRYFDRRVEELYKNCIIKRINKNDKPSKHNAIYYELTNYGFYYVFINYLHRDNGRILWERNDNNLIVVNFLLPYFKRNTLASINDRDIIREIFFYLEQCCLSISKLIIELREFDQQRYYMETISSRDLFATYSPHVKDFNIVKEIRIAGNDKHDPSILNTLEKLSLEEINMLEKLDHPERTDPVYEYLRDILNNDKHWFRFELAKHKSLLCNRIIEYIYSDYTLPKNDKDKKDRDKNKIEKDNSTRELKEDGKFLELVRLTKTRIDTYYNKFMPS